MAKKCKSKQEFVYVDGKKMTIPEFRAWVHEIEKGPFISMDEYLKEFDEWYEKFLNEVDLLEKTIPNEKEKKKKMNEWFENNK